MVWWVVLEVLKDYICCGKGVFCVLTALGLTLDERAILVVGWARPAPGRMMAHLCIVNIINITFNIKMVAVVNILLRILPCCFSLATVTTSSCLNSADHLVQSNLHNVVKFYDFIYLHINFTLLNTCTCPLFRFCCISKSQIWHKNDHL